MSSDGANYVAVITGVEADEFSGKVGPVGDSDSALDGNKFLATSPGGLNSPRLSRRFCIVKCFYSRIV